MKRPTIIVALLAFSVVFPAQAAAGTLNGVGTRVVTLLQGELASSFHTTAGNRVHYTVLGPTRSFTDLAQGKANFAALDAPLSKAQATACPNCREIPRSVTAVGIGYHIPKIGNGLNLTGSVLAGIYLGQITNWSDPRIEHLNPHRTLPNLKITPLFSSSASDDTYVLTAYLADVSHRWRSSIGAGSQVKFKAGTGEAGNTAIGRMIKKTAGAIGYMTTPYLFTQPQIHEARVQNAAGNFEYPSTDSVFDAAKPVTRIPDRGAWIVNPPKIRRQAYPIATFSSSLVLANPKQGRLLKRWLTFCVTTGRYAGLGTGFSALPASVQRAAKAAIRAL
ncbi:MAG TPA: substrate-binding domain-containing protein [Solirubrobacteraceae bacterium]|nr:substrate-binding domain-containing protein [Solirubrobacteraceae bacterium]